MSYDAKPRYFFIVGAISLGMSILIHFNALFLLIAPDTFHPLRNYNESSTSVLANLLTTTIITFCVFAVSSYILKPLDGLKKVGFKRFLLSVFLSLVSVLLLSELFFNLNHLVTGESNSGENHLLYFIKDIFIAFVVLTSVFVLKVFNEKRAVAIENQKLKYENLQGQYHSLKNQISPHFLFNSLTALKELIDKDPEISGKYVSHLSQVLRYTLLSNEHRTVSLSDEIRSLQSYFFLFKMRFGGNLKLELYVDPQYLNYRLPPLVVQTLTENAVKHNEVSKRFPLTIRVQTTDEGSLAVFNNLRPRLTTEPGTGTGLANLIKQYTLLNGGNVKITQSETEFRVEVPLIKPD